MMPLSMAAVGETVTIAKITGKDDVRMHLSELGYDIGAAVTVVSVLSGNLIVSVKDSRVGIDKTMANRILYTE